LDQFERNLDRASLKKRIGVERRRKSDEERSCGFNAELSTLQPTRPEEMVQLTLKYYIKCDFAPMRGSGANLKWWAAGVNAPDEVTGFGAGAFQGPAL